MNSFLENLLADLVANGLMAILSQISPKHRESLKQSAHVSDSYAKNPGLRTLLQRATASVARELDVDDTALTEQLKIALTSPDVDTIVRQLYSSQITKSNQLDSIQSLFIEVLSLRLGKSSEDLKELGTALFDTLRQACELTLSVAVDSGILAAHEAKSASRQVFLLNELGAIKKSLAYLTETKQPHIREILIFEERYRQQVKTRHAFITPPNFDSARKLPIDEIYVSPDFESTAKMKGQEREQLQLKDFLNSVYRTVLLGNPGGGKSTLAHKICHDLASRYDERLITGRQLSPVLVVLRDFGAEKKTRNCSILQFIELTANSHYQTEAPQGGFEYLLLNGHLAIIFDGLDELLDTSYRQEISADVEAFCNLYPSVPVLVTSREVGYEQAPLTDRIFETFRLSPFTDEQVGEYATKWFSADTEYTTEQQKQKSVAFLHESRVAPDLRSNPLMLGLMCNIYRGESYIPRNRPDVYEKCAVMLFERWDKMRGIQPSLPFEAHIRPTMMYLAHWIYSDDTLQGGVTEHRLITKATDYLCPKRFEDRDEAGSAATEFIEFCRGRAWVFTDTGTTKEGECLYQFTHRTFLEYFTAAHLFRTNPTPEALGSLLLPRIAKREWDVVNQLAFQIQNKNVEGAADVLLNNLLSESQRSRGNKALNILSFASRCLEFLVPSPKTTRDVCSAALQHCFNWIVSQLTKNRRTHRQNQRKGHADLTEIIESLLTAASENRSLIVDSLEKFFAQRLSGKEEDILGAMDMIMPLSFAIRPVTDHRTIDLDAVAYWDNFTDRVVNSNWNNVRKLCPTHRSIAYNALILGKISCEEFVNWHGVQSFFVAREYVLTRVIMPSAAELLLIALEHSSELPWWLRHLTNHRRVIEDVGKCFIKIDVPWIAGNDNSVDEHRYWYVGDLRHWSPDEDVTTRKELSSAEFFGVFCLLSPMLEAHEKDKHVIEWVKKSRRVPYESMRDIFLARFQHKQSRQIPLEIGTINLTEEQRRFITQWMQGSVDFVRRPRQDSTL